jgi:prolyl-tRNA synthetase
MRMSQLFGQTLRDIPSEAEVASHQLLVRAGFIRQLGAGIFSYLHLARRSLTKIESILRHEMNAIGGQEILMPVVHPADLWMETGRWYQIGPEMGRFKDRNEHNMALAMTHEEVVADLVRREIKSYKHLPRLIYHIQTKWRDDPRPRAGLIRVREFTMKDSYTLDADWDGLDKQYRAHYQAYFNVFRRCGLPVIAVKADVGMMGGTLAHEFMYLTPVGEDTILICDSCGYTANRQIARFRKPQNPPEDPLPYQKVPTPDVPTIEALANFLHMPKSKTAKAVFLMATVPEGKEIVERFIFAIVRGDMDLNETKLADALSLALHAPPLQLRPAMEDEIRAIGAVPGFASPVNLTPPPPGRSKIGPVIVVDDAVTTSPNLVSGANEKDYHLLNVNYGRDYTATAVADIAAANDGDACPECGAAMRAERGVEVGNIFKLGTRYSDALGCTYLDKEGKAQPVVMGSYGIGTGRLLACVAEAHHDDHGLTWPITVAPFQVHLVVLKGSEADADRLYTVLNAAGVEVLFDDREESAGVKFNDADLIGVPIRLTVSEKSLNQGGVELKLRQKTEKTIVPLEDIAVRIQFEINALEADIAQMVTPVEFVE